MNTRERAERFVKERGLAKITGVNALVDVLTEFADATSAASSTDDRPRCSYPRCGRMAKVMFLGSPWCDAHGPTEPRLGAPLPQKGAAERKTPP